jgi:conjugative relaxase-like TrwC/TraI family protein
MRPNAEEYGKQGTHEHRAGWDATFSAPKSISLTALVGGDSRVREAHRESVQIALEELERYTQARIGGNHPAEPTGRFLAAKFEHDTARPVNGYAAPQLHTHCVVFNMTQADDGRVRAVQPHSLFSSQQYATAIYQAELTYRLTQLGYEIERGRSGAPEIKGYSQEYLDASSPRSQQIRAHMERLGLSSRESAEIAAHATRDRKQILSPAEVLAAHRALALEFGNQPERVVTEARQRRRYLETKIEGTPDKYAGEAVTFARARNFEREAVVDRRLLMRDALRRAMGHASFAEVNRNFEGRVDRGEFLPVRGTKSEVEPRYTLPSMIAAEREVIRSVLEGQDCVGPIARWERLDRDIDPGLTASQRATVKNVLTSRDRIQGVQGTAGTGKTTALRVIRAIAEGEHHHVEGFAPTSRAAQELRSAGIPATTLQGFLFRAESHDEPARGKTLYFVDESSLASTEQVRRFLERLRPKDRVVLIGDVRQHQAVEAGRPFEQLQKGGMRTATLDEIVRQKDPGLKSAVEHLAKGSVSQGLTILRSHDRIQEVRNVDERHRAIARLFARAPVHTIVVSADNASRRQLNDAVRAELRASGSITGKETMFKVLAQQSDLTGADRQWAARYVPGDWLRYSRGSRSMGINAGDYRQVVDADSANNRLTVAAQDGKEITYDPRRLSGVNIYQEAERPFAQGDRIQFTAPDRTLGVANRELGTVERIVASRIDVRLENGRNIQLDTEQNRHFDHGYAVTSHSAQGLTSDRVLINVDSHAHPDLLNSRFAYVAVSRARHDARIFTDDASRLDALLGRDMTKTSALEMSTTAARANAQQRHGIGLE